jgi:hypothetical protein
LTEKADNLQTARFNIMQGVKAWYGQGTKKGGIQKDTACVVGCVVIAYLPLIISLPLCFEN